MLVCDGRPTDHASTELCERGGVVDLGVVSIAKGASCDFEVRILRGNVDDPLNTSEDVI